jgi:Fur family transcriptional regulator, ferric uptake regulator
MESRIERLCIERGLKMTGQRRVVARVLSDAGDHPDVEELYRRASALDQHISIATVYRTVRLFEEQGILERRDFGGGRARYEPSEDGPHYHLIDVETGKVVEFQDPEHERLMHAIASRLGFDLVSLRLELFGRRRGSAEVHRAEPAHPDAGNSEARPSEARPSEVGPSETRPSEAGPSEVGRDRDAQPDPNAAGRDPRLRDTIKGASQ